MSVLLPRVGMAKPSKQAARYISGGGLERCGRCRFFMPASACVRIQGPVSAGGWCRYYSEELVANFYQPQGAIGAGGGASLDIGFIDGSGVLSPLLTFTRASAGTYFDAGGVMRTAASGAPRFDYDPVTHAVLGLLIEEQRTNGVYPISAERQLGTSGTNTSAGWFGNSARRHDIHHSTYLPVIRRMQCVAMAL